MNRIAAFVAVVVGACLGRRRQPAARVPAPAPLGRVERLAILGRVAAWIAHEINNSLTVIVGAADLLRDSPELAGRDGVQDDFLLFVKAARRCEAAVKDLVSISFGNVMDAARIDVSEVAADAVAAEWRACEAAGISLVVETPEGLPAFAAGPEA